MVIKKKVISTMKKVLLSLIFLFLICCDDTSVEQNFIVILLDETDSFGIDKGDERFMFWNEIVEKAKRIVNFLNPGDKIVIIGIDDHGFDIDDIRVPEKTLDFDLYNFKRGKNILKKDIEALNRRKHKKNLTDILGALYHSAYFLKKHEGYNRIIFIFSDMVQTPAFPKLEDTKNLQFPEGTKCFCFYVGATGRENWERIVGYWLPVFKRANLVIEERNFYQRGEEIEKILQNLFE